MSVSWDSPPATTAVWYAGTLTITVPERNGYEDSYILQVSYNGVNYFTDSAPYTITNSTVTWSLNFPSFDGTIWYRVTTNDERTSQPVQPTEGAGAQVPCFLGNAPVLTPAGYRRIDSLREGDLVLTPTGASVAIQRVSVTDCAAGPSTNPYVIPKGRFGAERSLLISPNHKVAVDGAMVEARHLGLHQKERAGTLRYYNLELPASENIVVAGVEVESLAPVRRISITMSQLTILLTRKYGAAAGGADVLQKVMRVCRMRADGRIEVPVIRK